MSVKEITILLYLDSIGSDGPPCTPACMHYFSQPSQIERTFPIWTTVLSNEATFSSISRRACFCETELHGFAFNAMSGKNWTDGTEEVEEEEEEITASKATRSLSQRRGVVT